MSSLTDLVPSPTAGLANFNPLEGHTILQDSPEGCTCIYVYRGEGELN